ncbi:MAG: hypothetical protein Q8P18_29960 [Pseudomonadota bacterium]|nr:hypothetical protein [Pseudomonadota bacterium]
MISLVAFLFLNAAHARTETPVRATLGDGQILMGEVRTKTLLLKSGSGILEIPLSDVGEVVPADAGGLGESEGRVDVWLKNGSELRGTWADPKLAMSIRVGGDKVAVDLPMNDLSRFQLQGDARWPAGPVFRMRTRLGDDFLVDPARTQLVLENSFGTFSPLLSECRSVAPVSDPEGLWRIELQTGTVLLGHLQDGKVTVALPMGPAQMSVPLDQFVSLRVERWDARPVASGAVTNQVSRGGRGPDAPGYELAPLIEMSREEAMSPALPAETVATAAPRAIGTKAAQGAPSRAKQSVAVQDEWFDNDALQATKDAQDDGE